MSTTRTGRVGARLMAVALTLVVVLSACAPSDPVAVDEEFTQQPTAEPTATTAVPSPTPVAVPTIAPSPTTEPTATAHPTVEPTVTVQPTATTVPATPTTVARAPTATPAPAQPTPTATTPTVTPTPWINPDCYVGPGAADEPVWWCGGKICVVTAPHAGCPTTPPIMPVQIGCVINPQHPVAVRENLTFTAVQKPSGVPVDYAFDHGDGTLDRTTVSHAYYEHPGQYDVFLRWSHAGGKGTTFCGTVTVTSPEPVFVATDYQGRTLQAATDVAIGKGFIVRITRIDDQVYPGTTDYRTDRVNLEIDANVVTRATLG